MLNSYYLKMLNKVEKKVEVKKAVAPVKAAEVKPVTKPVAKVKEVSEKQRINLLERKVAALEAKVVKVLAAKKK